MSLIRKYHNHKLQTNPWHREEDPHNNHETPGRQTKQSNQLSLQVLLLIHWILVFQTGPRSFCAVFKVISSFAVISLGKKIKLVALLCLLGVIWLLSFYVSSSLCCGLVCHCDISRSYSLLNFEILKLFSYYQTNNAEPSEMPHVSPSVPMFA